MFAWIQLRIFNLPAFRAKNKGNEIALNYRSLNFCTPEVRRVPLNESVEQRSAKVAVRFCLIQNAWSLGALRSEQECFIAHCEPWGGFIALLHLGLIVELCMRLAFQSLELQSLNSVCH